MLLSSSKPRASKRRVDRLCGDTCSNVCPQTWLDKARTSIGQPWAFLMKMTVWLVLQFSVKFFWLFALNLKYIPYNGDFHETLDRIDVTYVLPKGVLMWETATTFVQKVGLIWLFASVIYHTNVIDGLKFFTTGTNVTTVLCA